MSLLKIMITSIISSSLAVASAVKSDLIITNNPSSHNPVYPAHWWAEVSKVGAPEWEVLPQEAGPGEVILSKRNELGLLSNFAPTQFTFRGQRFASMEGLWQSMKYPEAIIQITDEVVEHHDTYNIADPRLCDSNIVWKYTRAQVEQMTAFEAKEAGMSASENMKKLGINWVSFQGQRMVYKEKGNSPFYLLIKEAMEQKLLQNPKVMEVLLQTGDLKLRPDHHSEESELKAWQYFDIWMELRTKYQNTYVQ
jgi:predicted NAD-dependent protein-ADP-ribosyltransferase YbiA (DUF1768 family)